MPNKTRNAAEVWDGVACASRSRPGGDTGPFGLRSVPWVARVAQVRGMSRSLRKLLRDASHALGEALELTSRFPDAKERLQVALEDPGLADLKAMHQRLSAAAAELDSPRDPSAGSADL